MADLLAHFPAQEQVLCAEVDDAPVEGGTTETRGGNGPGLVEGRVTSVLPTNRFEDAHAALLRSPLTHKDQSRTHQNVRYEVTIGTCDCDEENNSHYERCGACAPRMTCTCPASVIAGVACIHRHAVATFSAEARNMLPVPRNWLSSNKAVMDPPSPCAFEDAEEIVPAADLYTSDEYFDPEHTTSSTFENCPSVDVQDKAKEEFIQFDTVCTTPFNIPFNQLREAAVGVMERCLPEEKTRPLFLPVEWRSSLVLYDGVTDLVTLPKMSTMRIALNSTAMDLMFYHNPLYRTEIGGMVKQLNRIYLLFIGNNPNFLSTVSVLRIHLDLSYLTTYYFIGLLLCFMTNMLLRQWPDLHMKECTDPSSLEVLKAFQQARDRLCEKIKEGINEMSRSKDEELQCNVN
ncbi:unnamed protein product [Cylicocyclus nassatus]|uniref:SWIM-type domain-containing protein n=1 Tax=Cylicocyclus nassatus TaxID=53992 RepID=A0AA36MDD6_CYLNA|nr:unnamed protein product [Cylicocyclus nassatus]